MLRNSIYLLTDSSQKLNVVGDAVKASGYYSLNKPFHSVAYYLNNFIGRIYLEGSLAKTPTEDDWFPIFLDSSNNYEQFPKDPLHPLGVTGDTGIFAYTFVANVKWVRARVDRSYLNPQPPVIDMVGNVRKALMVF